MKEKFMDIISNREQSSDTASVQWLVATGCVGYVIRVQSWIHVAYPTRPVASATGRKPNPQSSKLYSLST